MFSGCRGTGERQAGEAPFFSSYRDVPGVTNEEIGAIEALIGQTDSFVLGMLLSSEAFYSESGEIRGFSAYFCEWMSGFFGVRFAPAIYTYEGLFQGLDSGGIDFTGYLVPTEERRQTYYMTDPIVHRPIKYYRLKDGASISEIRKTRLPRYALLEGSPTAANVFSYAINGFEHVFISEYIDAYKLLESGEVDVIVGTASAEAVFDSFGDVVSEYYLPQISAPASLTAKNPELEPFISVVQKALDAGVFPYFNELYKQGNRDYKRHKMFLRLTDEEREYIKNNPVVKMGAQKYNYPVDFYNIHDGQWQGVFFDVLREVETLTGLSFEVSTEIDIEWSDLLYALEHGEISLVPQLGRTAAREGRFLWPQTVLMRGNYMLISRSDFPRLSVSDVFNVRVALIKDYAHTEIFHKMFPHHPNAIEYENQYSALTALERREADVLIGSIIQLLTLTNYEERHGYSANLVFDAVHKIVPSFNKNEAVLVSIMDKAFELIDYKGITEFWMHKSFDYQAKLLRARRPWVTGTIILLLISLIFMTYSYYNSAKKRKTIKKQAERIDAIIHNLPGVVFECIYDPPRYTYAFVSEGIKNLVGYTPEEVVGVIHFEDLLHPDDAAIVAENDKTLALGLPFEAIFRFITKDGTIKWVWERSRIVEWNADGSPRLLEGYYADITERRQFEAVKAANEAKSAFLATVSHEIRTPMNVIMGITEIMVRDETTPRNISENLYKIQNSGNLLLNIINDILDLSKIEAGKLELHPHKYETASLINDTVMLNMMRTESKPVEFRLRIEQKLPLFMVGDELRIRQILNNLLSNSFKYTKEGEVELSFSVETGDEESGLTLVFSVSDTGLGMTKEQLSALFDKFTRFNFEDNRTVEGTGLGMSIVQNLVKLMNGEIKVKSEPHKGTVVTVRLPQGYATPDVIGKELAKNLQNFQSSGMRQMQKAQVVYEPMPYGSVLIVDDVESNSFVAKGLMAPYKMRVDTAQSGFEAIDNIKSGKIYDIIFMDHMMPKMDGLEAAKIIREHGYTQPIVALTANAVSGQRDMFLSNGFDDFISKPIDIRRLNDILKKFVRDRQPPQAVSAALEQMKNRGESIEAAKPASSQLVDFFIRDAIRIAAELEALFEKRESFQDEDIKAYTTDVHAMKSALANVGELELSVFAKELEMAGRERNIAAILAETPVFIGQLKSVIAKLALQNENAESVEAAAEDYAYMREKLLALKKACEEYDKKTAKNIIIELRKKRWPLSTNQLLGDMAEKLMSGDFNDVSLAASRIVETV